MITISNIEVSNRQDEIQKVQNTPIIKRLNQIVRDASDISYIIGDTDDSNIVAIRDFDASKWGSPILTKANLIGLAKEYSLNVVTEIDTIEKPVILAESNQIGMELYCILLLPVNASISDDIESILCSIEKSVTDYPFVNDIAEEEFYTYEYNQKADYICGDFITDFEDILHWPLTWYKIKFPEANNAQFIDWMKYDLPYSDAEGILDSIEERINVQQDGSLDFSTGDIKKYVIELSRFVRGVILEWKNERIHKWKKDWLSLPGIIQKKA